MQSNIDFCHHSVSLSIEGRNFANTKLNQFFNKLLSEIRKLPIPVCIFLSGSLSRGEPSLLYRQGKPIGFCSDADTVIVTEDLRSKGLINNFIKNMADFMPEVQRTYYHLPLSHIMSSTLAVGGGLSWQTSYQGLQQPLFTTLPIMKATSPKIIPYHLFFALDTRIMAYLVGARRGTQGERSFQEITPSNYLLLKLICQCLELHTDISQTSYDFSLRGLIKTVKKNPIYTKHLPFDIHEVIKRRESFDPDSEIPKFNLYSFILENISFFLGGKEAIAIEKLNQIIRERLDVPNGYFIDLDLIMINSLFYYIKKDNLHKSILMEQIFKISQIQYEDKNVLETVNNFIVQLKNNETEALKNKLPHLLFRLNGYQIFLTKAIIHKGIQQ